jgi:hypothetical protein
LGKVRDDVLTVRRPVEQVARRQPVRVFWRIRGPNGLVITCALFQTALAFEVRVERQLGVSVRSELVASEWAGAFRASAWKVAALRLGGFDDLPLLAPGA